MNVERYPYRKVCKDSPYDPRMFFSALNEALNVFQNKNRKGVQFSGIHPLTIDDLREIFANFNGIWGNNEIYLPTEKCPKSNYWESNLTDEGDSECL